MHPYEATRVPLVYYEKGYDFRKLRLSSQADSDSCRHSILDCSRRYLSLCELTIFLKISVTSWVLTMMETSKPRCLKSRPESAF